VKRDISAQFIGELGKVSPEFTIRLQKPGPKRSAEKIHKMSMVSPEFNPLEKLLHSSAISKKPVSPEKIFHEGVTQERLITLPLQETRMSERQDVWKADEHSLFEAENNEQKGPLPWREDTIGEVLEA